MFNQTFLEAVFQLQEQIERLGENGMKIENICFAPMVTEESEKPTVSQCVVQSLYGYFNNSMENLFETDKENGYVTNYLNKLDKCLTWVKHTRMPFELETKIKWLNIFISLQQSIWHQMLGTVQRARWVQRAYFWPLQLAGNYFERVAFWIFEGHFYPGLLIWLCVIWSRFQSNRESHWVAIQKLNLENRSITRSQLA